MNRWVCPCGSSTVRDSDPGGVSDHVDYTQGHVGECAPIIVMAMRGHDAAQCVAPHEIEDPSRFVCGIDQELFARNGAAQ